MKCFFALLCLIASPTWAATYAELDKNGVVLQVVVVNDAVESGETAGEREASGIAFLRKLYNGGDWVKTFADGRRKNYAGIGYVFDRNTNAFIPPKPEFSSWTLDTEKGQWLAPVERPKDGKAHIWDEVNRAWVTLGK